MRFVGVVAAVVAASCSPSVQDQMNADNAAIEAASANDMLASRDAEITRLTGELAAARNAVAATRDEPMDDYSAADRANADRVEAAAASKYADNCYKDYCPCEQPQEGMDSVLCDQLEAGLDVPIESMIAGKGFREARRQAAELGY